MSFVESIYPKMAIKFQFLTNWEIGICALIPKQVRSEVIFRIFKICISFFFKKKNEKRKKISLKNRGDDIIKQQGGKTILLYFTYISI